MDIPALRSQIDAIDADILRLVAQRFALAEQVNVSKAEQGLPLLDAARESEMIAAARASARPPLTPDNAEDALRSILNLSRRWVYGRSAAAKARTSRICILGLGLIGGSLARALKHANPAHQIAGLDLPDRHALPAGSGLFSGLFVPDDGAAAVSNADVVFLCAPPARNLELLDALRRDVPATAVVSDVTGLKLEIMERAEQLGFNGAGPAFVGGHPMAGSEVTGFEASRTDLFTDRAWVLTPRPNAAIEPLQRVRELAESAGAYVELMSPEEHDRVIVTVSHLPQLVSVALMLTVAGRDRGISGPALREMTRLAGSSVRLWNELLAEVRPQAVSELQRMRAYLTELEIALSFREPLDKWFDRAASLRKGMLSGGRAAGVHE